MVQNTPLYIKENSSEESTRLSGQIGSRDSLLKQRDSFLKQRDSFLLSHNNSTSSGWICEDECGIVRNPRNKHISLSNREMTCKSARVRGYSYIIPLEKKIIYIERYREVGNNASQPPQPPQNKMSNIMEMYIDMLFGREINGDLLVAEVKRVCKQKK